MSKYTTELRYICETKSGFDLDTIDSHTPDEIITASRATIFNFSYPIYDESHRAELECKILRHYYTQEICAETYGLWHLWLDARMNDIMPKYNKLYRMEALTLQKELSNVDIQHSTTREDDFTRTDNLTDTDSHTRTDNLSQVEQGSHGTTDKFSDTPQGTVTNVDNGTYLTEYRKIDETTGNTTTNTGTQTNAGSVTHTGTQRNAGSQDVDGWEKGYRGSKTYAELIADYADKVLNIDMLIINELRNLFFMLW